MSSSKRGNGGVVGVENNPTTSVASGIWGLNEVLEARKNGLWPTMSLYNYPVEQSLRFDGSSYLSRTFGSNGNSLKLTYSLWVKFSAFGIGGLLLLAQTGTQISSMTITNANQFNFNSLGNTYNVVTTPVYRDSSGWYHVVFTYDGAQTAQSDRAYISVNGVKLTDVYSVNSGFFPVNHSQPHFNTAIPHYIGITGTYNTLPLNGYLANIHFIDGQALSPYFFGELVGGVWTPKAFDGTASDGNTGSATSSYGTNGFHLTFAPDTVDTGTTPNRFLDQSPNSNHWDIY